MGTTVVNFVECHGRAKQKFLEVQEPFFKKVPGRRRQKQKSESMINNLILQLLSVFVCVCPWQNNNACAIGIAAHG
jgi:hypothetical protein